MQSKTANGITGKVLFKEAVCVAVFTDIFKAVVRTLDFNAPS